MLVCLVLSAWLCIAQIVGNTLFLLGCLLCFLLLTALATWQGSVTLILLYFLPWAPLLKLSPDAISFYTLALVGACILCFFKRRCSININCAILALVLTVLTLIAQFLDGARPSMSYLLFIFCLMLFPNVTSELRATVRFPRLTLFFSAGIIAAALSAKELVAYSRIARYIDVYSWDIVTRHSGYYGDSNFYSAHISAALAGVLLLFLAARRGRERLLWLILAVALLYCGFLSGSKGFFVTLAALALVWFIRFLSAKGKISGKFFLLATIGAAAWLAISSGIFAEQWEVFLFRFGQSSTISGLTTGRSELWKIYLDTLLSEPKLLLLGKGFVNVVLYRHASHNTLIQSVYQFGIPGAALLFAWVYYYLRKTLHHFPGTTPLLEAAVLLIGVFLPWMALDVLFFDEFFLMPLYAVGGIVYFRQIPHSAQIDTHEGGTSYVRKKH